VNFIIFKNLRPLEEKAEADLETKSKNPRVAEV